MHVVNQSKRLRTPKRPSFTTYECLLAITDLTEGSKLKKDRHKKYLLKKARKNQIIEVIHDPKWRDKVSEEAKKEVDNRDWLFRISNALLYLGDYSWWGWEYRSPWGLMCATNPQALKMTCWEGQPGRMLLLGEQGLGDEIMFASCIPDLQEMDVEVTLMCDERLIPVMSRSFGIECIPRKIGKELEDIHRIKDNYDFYFPLGELPRFFRQSVEEFPGKPFLTPNPDRLREMEPYRGATGVSWRGRNGFYPREEFPQGLSLQYDTRWDEYREGDGLHIDPVKDIDGLITLIYVLDRVLCVSTSVAHMAGAVGTPTDVILAPIETRHPENMINWRWRGGISKKSPWYNSVTIYRGLNEWNVSGLKQWQTLNIAQSA